MATPLQSLLAIIAIAAGLIGLLYAWLALRRAGLPSGWRLLKEGGGTGVVGFTAIVALVLFLSTVPATKPFAPGMTLGWGFAIGVVLAFCAMFGASGGTVSAVAALASASIGPSLCLVLFRGDPGSALAGCALGAVFVAAAFSGALRPRLLTADDGSALAPVVRGLETHALAVSAVTAGALLAIEHFPRSAPSATAGGYWSLPGLLAAAGALLLILAGGGAAHPTRWRALSAGSVAALGVTLVAGVLQWKLLPKLSWPAPLFGALGLGLLAAIFLHEEQSTDGAGEPRPTLAAFAAALIAVAVAGLAFRQLMGYGEALALVAATIVAASVYAAQDRRTEPLAESLAFGAAAIMALLTWYRVFVEATSAGHPLDFQQYYSFIAITAGAGIGFAALSFVDGGARLIRGDRLPLAVLERVFGLGILIVAAPLVAAALWAEQGVSALLAGLVVGQAVWMLMAATSGGPERQRALVGAPHIFSLAVTLIAARFAPIVIGLELTRAQKVVLVAAVAVIALVALMADALRRPRPAVTPVEGTADETAA